MKIKKDERLDGITEEVALYCFRDNIFVLDPFVKAKYVR